MARPPLEPSLALHRRMHAVRGAWRTTLPFLIAALLMAAFTVSPNVGAEPAPYSPYEKGAIKEASTDLKQQVDPSPEGKTIEAILLRPLDVFEERDPLPGFFQDFLNFFHKTTQPFIVEREVLLKVGQTWNQRLVDETARNLRGIRQLSLVLCVPLKGSAPDKVKLLVITKDIWSLRLNSDVRFADGQLEDLLLAPSEENLAGLHHSLGTRFRYEPDVLTFGVSYKVPRIGDSWLSAVVSTNVLVNHATGEFEGTSGSFAYGQPLYSTQTEWSYIAALQWETEVTRVFRGIRPIRVDLEATPQEDKIPLVYDSEAIAGSATVVRSFGSDIKFDINFGAEASRNVFRMHQAERYAPQIVQAFESEQLPLTDTQVYPFVGASTYSTTFKSYIDLNTLGLQEDYRMGHDAYVKAYPVLEAIGSSRSFMGLAGGALYTVPIGDGLARVYADTVVEAAPEQIYDARIIVGGRITSPRLGFGRLTIDAFSTQRLENFSNARSSLGGDTRLRGYPSGAYRGENVIAYNAELRSMPLELWTMQVGAAAFYDAGAAYDSNDDLDLRQAVGTGLRVVFPQLDRTVIRADWAVPLDLDPELGQTSALPGRFVVTFKQAFGMPSVGPPSATN